MRLALNNKRNGFTFVELLIIVSISIIIGSIGALSIPSTLKDRKTFELAATELMANFYDAQQRSMSQDLGQQWGIRLVADAVNKDFYQVFYGANYDTGTVVKTVTLPLSVQFVSPAPGDPPVDIIFQKVTGYTDSQSIILVMTATLGDPNEQKIFITISNKGLLSSSEDAPTYDFSISVAPSSDNVLVGEATNATVNLSLLAGEAQLTTLSASNVPAGATVSFSPVACSPACSSAMVINTSTSTPGGTTQIPIAAVAGTTTRTANFILTVSSATVPGAPTIGTATAGNAQATVTFTAPGSNGGSAITGYTVTSNPGGLTGTGSASPITVTGLTNGTAYTFTVTATNAIGTGPASAASNSVTPATVPGAPTSLAATAGDMQISLSWTAPSDTGGGITNYEIYRGTTSGGETFLIELGNVLTYIDTAVTNGVTYYYKVSAKNSAGEGVKSNESYQLVWDRTAASANFGAIYGSASAVLGNNMYMLGGMIVGYRSRAVYTSTDGITWPSLGLATGWTDRYNHSALTFNNKIWVMGGFSSSGNKNDVYYSTDGVNYTQATAAAGWSARNMFTAVVYDGKMWVMGGNDGARKNDVWYSTDGVTWTQATASAGWSIRDALTSFVYDGKMWIAGGYPYKNDVWYSTNGVNWTQATAAAGWSARNYIFSGIYNNKIWIMGGSSDNYPGGVHLNDIWSSTDGATWTQVISSAAWSVRSDGESLVFNNKLWVIGGKIGISTGYTGLADVWNIQTSVTPPSAPVVAAAPGDTQIVLSWSAPSNGGSYISGYKIYRGTTSGGETFLTEIGNVSTYTDAGLTNGSTYYYKVSAINSNGDSPLSAEASAVSAAVPGAPTSLAATAGDMQISLSWTAPSDTGGGITNYEIYRGTTSGGETFLIELGNVLTYIDTAVTNGVTYYYKVSAKNSAGEGVKSNESYQLVWDRTTTSLPLLFGSAVVSSGSKMLITGGYVKSEGRTNNVWSSTDGVTWTPVAAQWPARNTHVALFFNNKFWVLGGSPYSGTLNDVWYSTDGVSWTQATASAPWSGRNYFGAVVYDGKMWVMGGASGELKNNNVWYSIDGINWTQATASAAWSGRSNHKVFTYNGKMWLVGGMDGSGTTSDVWYSTDGANWTQAAASTAWGQKRDLYGAVFNDKMIVAGGTYGGGDFNNYIWSSTDGVTWTAELSAPWSARYDLETTTIFNNKLWFVGGKYNSDVWNIQAGIKRIFVTSTAYNGNLGGLAGADAKCAARATAVGLSGTWKAWISSGATDPTDARDRLTQNSSPYVNMRGNKVADNWADLVDGSLDAAINYNESGGSGGAQAWTGSYSNGTRYFSQDCSASGAGWTSSTGTGGDAGLEGLVDSTSGTWSNHGTYSCNGSLPLYCFEQ